jgi:ribosomal protein S2
MQIPEKVFDLYKEFGDEMIRSFGVLCQINYVKKMGVGGSLPTVKTSKTLRPYDNASSFLQNESYEETETSENIKLRVYWDRKAFKKIADLEIPDGGIMTIGYLSDINKIKNCDTLIPNIENLAYTNKRFTKVDEPIPWGLRKDRYFVCGWSI